MKQTERAKRVRQWKYENEIAVKKLNDAHREAREKYLKENPSLTK